MSPCITVLKKSSAEDVCILYMFIQLYIVQLYFSVLLKEECKLSTDGCIVLITHQLVCCTHRILSCKVSFQFNKNIRSSKGFEVN